MLNLKIEFSKIITQTCKCQLEISKRQLYFKQTVISVKSWAWQPHQEILQGKTIQTQHLLPLPSSIPNYC